MLTLYLKSIKDYVNDTCTIFETTDYICDTINLTKTEIAYNSSGSNFKRTTQNTSYSTFITTI